MNTTTTPNPDPKIQPNPGPDDELHIFTTGRWDPTLTTSPLNTQVSCNHPSPIYMLENHWTRLQVAQWGISCFSAHKPQSKLGAGPAFLLSAMQGYVQQWQKAHPDDDPPSLRIKMRFYPNGRMGCEIDKVQRLPFDVLFPPTFDEDRFETGPEWTVVLDTEPTEPAEVTMFKTSDRRCYARARAAAGIVVTATKEVMLFTPEGLVFDCSITTPYFLRDGKWVTPSSSCGGQQGTTRRWALEKGLAVEGTIQADEMINGETVWLSNAVRGYFRAVYTAKEKTRPKS